MNALLTFLIGAFSIFHPAAGGGAHALTTQQHAAGAVRAALRAPSPSDTNGGGIFKRK